MNHRFLNFKALPFERRAEIVHRIIETAQSPEMRRFQAACRAVLGDKKSRKELRRVRVRCIAYIIAKRGRLSAA